MHDELPPGGSMTVSIVIVSYNGRELLDRCLPETIAQARAQDAEIIVVDNASHDGSADHLRQRYPSVHLVENARNEGFAGGCNAGVNAARGERIVLLNNDALPNPGWLGNLLRALDPPDVAIAASVIHETRYPEGYALGTGSISVIGHPIPNVGRDLDRPFYASGCALAFKRSIFPAPFDPIYFAYFEDALLAWRAHLMGYTVARALDSSVEHLGSVTALRLPSLSAYYYERNKLLTLLLCYEAATLRKLAPLYAFDGALRLAEDVWHLAKGPRLAPTVWKRYALVLRGIAWLIGNRRAVASRRRLVQRERRRTDADITRLLSGKIFDDFLPTRAHAIANTLSVAYCRLVGIPTAENAGAPTPAPRSQGAHPSTG